MKKYDLLIFIGRFQPFHLGHKQVVVDALEQAHRVLILVGSAFQARTIKNPFTYAERHDLIQCSLDPHHLSRTSILPLRDYIYSNPQWIAQVQQLVAVNSNPTDKIGIIGYQKDDSSWYLNEFPQWDYLEVRYNDSIDASAIRQLWLTESSPKFTSGAMTVDAHRFMYTTFTKQQSVEYKRLVREFDTITSYKKSFEHLKHPVQFITADAVVIQSGHILLVKRKSSPGEGLWALPGGFVQVDEHIKDGMLRELDEETAIKVPLKALRGSIRSSHVFDAPGRSLRGRTVTHAFYLDLAPGPLPKVKGRDDAAKAKWFTLAEFNQMEELMFEDHFHIVNHFLGKAEEA